MRKLISVAMLANDLDINGISTVVMNYCRNIDMSKFKIAIIAGLPVHPGYLTECKKNNIEIIELPPRKTETIKYYTALFKILKKHRFDIIHIHGNSATITPELMLAFLSGIKIRIAHCHNSTCTNMRIHKTLLPFFNMLYTHAFACSNLAGCWLFGKRNFYVIPNGFDTLKYKYSVQNRIAVRQRLGIENKYVIGHIGRFNNQKNHLFLYQIFVEIAKNNSNAVLLVVGNGPDYEKEKKILRNHPYKNRIILYGETSNTSELYSAMDIFVLTSKHEGLGIVLLEAQINGLPCISSDVVPSEVIISNRIELLSLNSDIRVWSDKIKEFGISKNRDEFYNTNLKQIKKYDIQWNVKKLENLYIDFIKQIKSKWEKMI